MRHKAFISYSHKADATLAAELQHALQQFAKPYYALRAIPIFRDHTDLAANPALWPKIAEALKDAEWLLLFASVLSAQSPWVKREIDQWLQQHNGQPTNLLILWTDGTLHWDDRRGDFDWSQTDALPQSLDWDPADAHPRKLEAVFSHAPMYVDLRWARESRPLSTRDPRFVDQVATIASALRNVSKRELIGQDVAEHQRFRRFRARLIGGLIATILISLIAVTVATIARHAAVTQRNRAVAQGLMVEVERLSRTMPGSLRLQALLVTDSVRRAPLPENEAWLREFVTSAAKPIGSVAPKPNAHTFAAVFSPDGKRFATAGDDSSSCVFDAGSGTRIACAKLPGQGRSVAFSGDGKLVASGGEGGLRIFDARTGATVFIDENPFTVTSVTFPPQPNTVGGFIHDIGSFTFDFHQRKLMPAHKALSSTGRLLFSPDGHFVSIVGASLQCVLYDTNTGAEILGMPTKGEIEDAAFSQDGQWFAVAFDSTISVLDVRKGFRHVGEFDFGGANSVAISGDNRYLGATSAKAGVVRLWSMPDLEPVFERPLEKAEQIRFDAKGHRFLAWSTSGNWMVGDPGLWAVLTRDALPKLYGAALAPGGERVVTYGPDHGTHLWKVPGSQGPPSIVGEWIQGPMSPDGGWVAVERAAGSSLRSTSSGQDVFHFGGIGRVIGISNAGDRLALEQRERPAVAIVEPLRGKTTASLSGQPPCSFAFESNNRKMALLCNDGILREFDTGSAIERRRLLVGANSSVRAVCDSAVGLSTVLAGKRVVDWNNTELFRWPDSAEIWHIAFSPDCSQLAVSTSTGQWRVYDRSTKVELARKQEAGTIRALRFSMDGRYLETSITPQARPISLQHVRNPLRSDELLEEACSLLDRNLTRTEWSHYLVDEPYRPTCPNRRAE